MGYRLIGSYTSPFVRRLRLAMYDRVDFELEVVNYMEEPGKSYLQSISPINKLPILIDGQQKIFDSRVIYNYLARRHDWKALTVDEENLVSAIESGMDTCVNLFLLKKGGLDPASDNWYLQRQRERVPSVLDYLKPWIEKLNPSQVSDWNFASMSLYSFLYWAQFRGMLDLSGRPECLKFLETFQGKPGVAETTIPT